MELPWDSESFLQQCGRSHRTNQCSAPEYVFVSTSVPCEVRFVHSVVQRLTSLGALTCGDRSCVMSPRARGGDPTEWSVPSRRMAAIETWYRAQMGEGVVREPLPPFLRRSEIPSSSARADTFLLRLIDAVQPVPPDGWAEEEGGALSGLTSGHVMSAVREVHPFLSSVWEGETVWRPAIHLSFPAECRRCIESLLSAHSRVEASRTLGLLPRAILDLIIGMYASDPLGVGGGVATGVVEQTSLCSVRFSQWGSFTTENLQNRMLGFRLPSQKAAVDLVVFHSKSRPGGEGGVVAVEDFVGKEGISVRCVYASRCSVYSQDDAVRLRVEASPLPVEAGVREGEEVLRDLVTAHVFLVREGEGEGEGGRGGGGVAWMRRAGGKERTASRFTFKQPPPCMRPRSWTASGLKSQKRRPTTAWDSFGRPSQILRDSAMRTAGPPNEKGRTPISSTPWAVSLKMRLSTDGRFLL